MILLLDNYDSFSANLARYLERLDLSVTSVRSDRITLAGIEALQPEAIVISPGPAARWKRASASTACAPFRAAFRFWGSASGIR